MDTFCEQLVAKKKTTATKVFVVVLFLSSIIVALFLFVFSSLLGHFSMFGYLAAFGVIFGAYQLTLRQNIEYEYIITNGELDVDKIIARRKRKRILTTKINSWEKFDKFESMDFKGNTVVDASTEMSSDRNYYAIFDNKELGKTLLVFCPNEKVLANINKYK